MFDPLSWLPKYFLNRFYLGVIILFIAGIVKTIFWLLGDN